jgi:AraC-like DNA-binding protein
MREPPLAPPSFKVSQAAGPATMITILYAGVAVIDAVATIYFAWRSREFRKFLAGAFFVSGGIQFYLYLGDVSVPLWALTLSCARAQRGALHHSPRPLPDMLVLWLYQKAKGFDQPSTRTLRLIRRTKESVEGHVSSALRLRNVARAVGISPAYLTDMFRRVEGLLLHKYIVQLRLARAVFELPHVNDLTTLAYELGFSSHSHFAVAFRTAFGCTPSQFRSSARRPARPGMFSRRGRSRVC